MADSRIELAIIMGAPGAQIKALKSILTEDQLRKYNSSIEESKQKFIDKNQVTDPELLAQLDKYFV